MVFLEERRLSYKINGRFLLKDFFRKLGIWLKMENILRK